MSLLSVENLTIGYGAQTVLQSVNLSIEPGEIVTIVGPNGSGKTSLLRAIIGAVRPTLKLLPYRMTFWQLKKRRLLIIAQTLRLTHEPLLQMKMFQGRSF